MSNRTAAILSEVKQLPAEEFADLLDELIVLSHERSDPEIESAWIEEARRRMAETDADPDSLLDGEPILKALREGRCP